MSAVTTVDGFLQFLKKLWCCVGGRDKNKNLVLSNELIKVELPSVSPSSERLRKKTTRKKANNTDFTEGHPSE